MDLSKYSAETLHEIYEVVRDVKSTLDNVGEKYVIVARNKGCKLTLTDGEFELRVGASPPENMNLAQLTELEIDIQRNKELSKKRSYRLLAAHSMFEAFTTYSLMNLRNVNGSVSITYSEKIIKLSAGPDNWIITLYEDGRPLGASAVEYLYTDSTDIELIEFEKIQQEMSTLVLANIG